jgi:hypothetical protein
MKSSRRPPAERCASRLPLLLAVLATISVSTGAAAPDGATGRELLRDPQAAQGLRLLAPTGGGRAIGELRTQAAGAPVWELAQWNSRFPFTNKSTLPASSLAASNSAQWITWDRPSRSESAVLSLGVDSRTAYNGRLRQSPSESWVHLLVQQSIADAPSLSEAASFRLHFEARLRESETFRPEGYSTNLHAAQFQVVVTLNNFRRDSPGFGDYLWFVLPVYDDRHDVPPEYVAQDFAVTRGKLIYNPGGAALGVRPMGVGHWLEVDCDLRPWLERALETAWARGYLRDSKSLADYRLAHLNVGWEVPGLNRVAMDLSGLSLRAQTGTYRPDARRPQSDEQLRDWLENMVVSHRFTAGEVVAATGLSFDEVAAAMRKFDLAGRQPARHIAGEPLRVLPYPGGRHPRIGFFEGAIQPQRETKVSVFTPWDESGYVVVDVPEAVFSNLGLTYLAHTHIPTLWDQRGETLPHLEWQHRPDGSLVSERVLPNGIAFGATVRPAATEVRMELWLHNGTSEKLTGLRVQNCVMLARAPGFVSQTLTNKLFHPPYSAARSTDARRWIITAWDPVQRCWGNERCPCLHSDPQFPDCPPAATVRARGWLSFYEGADIEGEFKRIESIKWR